ncbi:carbohydrate ABC transporter permease [Pseudactinotalea sp. Z1739]|uniref:carbohydrate ABC transporter permease n=1 Tax=Pseudactinotalea sp. Z1739 TaxID=3413028 RepID=UPI003C7B6BBA
MRVGTASSQHPAVRVLVWILLMAGILLFLSNGLWALRTSLLPSEKILSFPPQILPDEVTLSHYQRVLTGQFGRWFANSAIVAFGTVLLVLMVSVPAAYGATRFRFRGQTALLFVILAGMAIGQVSTVVPFYFMATRLGLINTYGVLIVVYAVWMTPLAVWLLRGYFKTVPPQLDEAAMIDGCSRLGAMLRVVVPLTRPGMAAAALIVFVYSWNEFILAVVLTSTDDMRTVPVGIHMFLATYGVDWGAISAASIVSLIPIVMLFLLLQRHFIQGLTAGTLGSQ